jgi:D-sedoheptulose 7-phosphate isomerase
MLMHRFNGTRSQPERYVNGLAVEDYFQSLSQLIPRLPYSTINLAIAALLRAFEENRTVFVFGNGGSASTASHIACDLNKGTSENARSRRIKVIALTDNVPLLTAWANDVSYEHVFSEQLKNFVGARDVVFAISASGNSPNVLRALETAREARAITLGITGYQGGRMKALCDLCAIVPSDNMQMIEDLHHAIAHSIFTAVRDHLRLRTVKVSGEVSDERKAA